LHKPLPLGKVAGSEQRLLYLLKSSCIVLRFSNTSYPVSNSLHICTFLFDTLFSTKRIEGATSETGDG
jgi:hypothetical protein